MQHINVISLSGWALVVLTLWAVLGIDWGVFIFSSLGYWAAWVLGENE